MFLLLLESSFDQSHWFAINGSQNMGCLVGTIRIFLSQFSDPGSRYLKGDERTSVGFSVLISFSFWPVYGFAD